MADRIVDLEDLLARYAVLSPLSAGKAVSQGQGAYLPMHMLRRGIIWAWLAWHASKPFAEISKKLQELLERAYYCYQINNNYNYSRSINDSFVIQCAILSGSATSAGRAAEFVEAAVPSSSLDQYTEAWTGVLKAAILRRRDEELAQLNVLKRGTPLRTFPWPSVKLVESFVARDWQQFHDDVNDNINSHLSSASRSTLGSSRGRDSHGVNLATVNDYFMWPWVAASFAKLAILDGATIDGDPLWLPVGFIQARHDP